MYIKASAPGKDSFYCAYIVNQMNMKLINTNINWLHSQLKPISLVIKTNEFIQIF